MYSLRKFSRWKACVCWVGMFLICVSGKASEELRSPNGKIVVSGVPSTEGFKVSYEKGNEAIPVVRISNVGLQLLQTETDFEYIRMLRLWCR